MAYDHVIFKGTIAEITDHGFWVDMVDDDGVRSAAEIKKTVIKPGQEERLITGNDFTWIVDPKNNINDFELYPLHYWTAEEIEKSKKWIKELEKIIWG